MASESRKEYLCFRREIMKKHLINKLICARCGYKSKSIHLHHISELVNGGENIEANLIPLCSCCHSEWDYFNGAGFTFKEFLQTPDISGFAILTKNARGIGNLNFDTAIKAAFHSLRFRNATKDGQDIDEYLEEYKRQNQIFNTFTYWDA